MFYFLKRAVTWWNSQTLGTQLFTWRKGERVGEDDLGNTYYQTTGGVRRWVIFNGEAKHPACRPNGTVGCITRTSYRPPRRHCRTRFGKSRTR